MIGDVHQEICLFWFKSNLLALYEEHIVSRSSTEAKYQNLANVVAEMTWLQSL